MGKTPHRILIIRPSAMGDIVMASPLLTALHQTWPEAEIDWLIDPGLIDLLRHNKEISRLVPWSKQEWRTLLKRGRWLQLARQIRELSLLLRARNYDLCLEAQGLLRARMLAALSGARQRVGFISREPGAFLLHRTISKGPDSSSMSSEYRFMAEALQLDPGEFAPRLTLGSEECSWLHQELARQKIEPGGYVILAPFTTRLQKHWLADRWIEVADQLWQSWRLPTIILGSGAEKEAAVSMARNRNHIFTWAGKSTLGQSMAVVANCQLLIGVDTGLTHMGSAFGRPTVALFGATSPYLQCSQKNTRVIYHPRSCSPCRRRPTCNGNFPCMKSITVQQVLDAAYETGGLPSP